MIYHVYSKFNPENDRVKNALLSWKSRTDIVDLPVTDSDLSRNIDGLPFLKDLLDFAYNKCENDKDIILYTNSDIGIVNDNIYFPQPCFFSVRKNVEEIKQYSQKDLKVVKYENSVNCDVFGFSKKWYKENRDKIPDFLIGSPTWDLAMICLLNGERINNTFFHVDHSSKWQEEGYVYKHQRNRDLFLRFCNENNLPFVTNDEIIKKDLFSYMSLNHGFSYLLKPRFITFYTPSHKDLFELSKKSFYKTFGDSYMLTSVEHSVQYCESTNYHTNGWRNTQVNKISAVLSFLRKLPENNIFIFCDSDILHLDDYIEDIVENLEYCDMVAQKSYSRIRHYEQFCSGFYAARKTRKVVKFIEKIFKDLNSNLSDENVADQYFMNKNSHMLNILELSDDYFNPGAYSNGVVVEPDQFDDIVTKLPEEVKIVHANWMKGNHTKLSFMQKVYDNFFED
jgi:Nucleotide-diphospho-sugar transferase